MSLKRQFELIGKKLGMKIKVIITDGSQPIGSGLGPVLEARDVLYVLKNDYRMPLDLKEKSLKLAGLMLKMAGKKDNARELLEKGLAYKKFIEIVKAQGGKEVNPENEGQDRGSGSLRYLSTPRFESNLPQAGRAGLHLRRWSD